jgi:hypothetical protein
MGMVRRRRKRRRRGMLLIMMMLTRRRRMRLMTRSIVAYPSTPDHAHRPLTVLHSNGPRLAVDFVNHTLDAPSRNLSGKVSSAIMLLLPSEECAPLLDDDVTVSPVSCRRRPRDPPALPVLGGYQDFNLIPRSQDYGHGHQRGGSATSATAP